MISLIRFYQLVLKPLLDGVLQSAFGFHFKCKIEATGVSCSQYTIQQIEKHGTISGLFRGLKRIMRCWGM